MRVLAIDPGPVESAWVLFEYGNGGRLIDSGKDCSKRLLDNVRYGNFEPCTTAIEMIASYGMPVGAEVFETCLLIGQLMEACRGEQHLVYRKDVKLHLCNSPRANDATIRAALIDRFGGKAKAIGNKRSPGPLYGVSGDVWQALALAVTFSETRAKGAA